MSRILQDIFGDDNYLDLTGKGAHAFTSMKASTQSRSSLTTRYSASNSNHNSRLGNLAQLDQAVVKIVRNGGVKNLKQLAQQMDYIAKDGDAELTVNNQGIPYSNSDGKFEAEMEEWKKDFKRMEKGGKTYHLVVSFPPNVSRETAADIGRDYAEAITNGALGDHYKTLHAHHTDTDHPHTHIIVNRMGESGRTLSIHPMQDITVDTLRELQVSIAREHGVYMNATRRHTRPNRSSEPVSLGRHHAKKAGRTLPDKELSPSRAGERYQTDQLPLAHNALKALQASDVIFGGGKGRPLSGIFEKMLSSSSAPTSNDKMRLAIMSDEIAEKARKYITEGGEQLKGITDAPKRQKAAKALKVLSDALGPLLSDKDKAAWGYKESGVGLVFAERARVKSEIHERNNERSRDDDYGL